MAFVTAQLFFIIRFVCFPIFKKDDAAVLPLSHQPNILAGMTLNDMMTLRRNGLFLALSSCQSPHCILSFCFYACSRYSFPVFVTNITFLRLKEWLSQITRAKMWFWMFTTDEASTRVQARLAMIHLQKPFV